MRNFLRFGGSAAAALAFAAPRRALWRMLATGDWASMNAKRFHWTAKPAGPGSQFTIESTNE